MFVETWCNEHVELRRHHRKRQKRRAEQAELDLCEQEFLRRRVDELDLRLGAGRELVGPEQEIVDVLGEEEADEEHREESNERLDQPRAQLDQMLDQGRLRRFDFVFL